MNEAPHHFHLPGDCQPGTITLCCQAREAGGVRWLHVPVDRDLWNGMGEDWREECRALARRQFGDETAAVDVVDVPALVETEDTRS